VGADRQRRGGAGRAPADPDGAFAVGRFDVVPAGTSSTGAPLRILTPAGQAAEAGFAAEATPKLLAAAERWFGTPYPYAKLDSRS
jgi:alanyl aminopeptidase